MKEDNLILRPLEARKPKNRVLEFASVEPIEKLVIYNGSPRKKGSNSSIILEKVIESLGNRVEIRDLKKTDQWNGWADSFIHEKHVMFFMPLYVHAMPSHVMEFIEKLQPSKGSISFFVQSGFPESSQSHYLEAYFEQLAPRLGRAYLGTAIKGGMEGLQMRPAAGQDKMIEPIVETFSNLVNEGKFNPADIHKLASPVRLGKGTQLVFQLFNKKINALIWDQKLKTNHAYEKSYDRPYSKE